MGGMPILEFGNWFHQVSAFYLGVIPFFIYLNNFAGPKAMEPVFVRDYLIAQFDKMATTPGAATTATSTTAVAAKGFQPTAGKVPVMPKQLFARGAYARMGLAVARKAIFKH